MPATHARFNLTWGQAAAWLGRHWEHLFAGAWNCLFAAALVALVLDRHQNGEWKEDVRSMADIAVQVGKHQRMRGDWLAPESALKTEMAGDIAATLERRGGRAILRFSGFSDFRDCRRTGRAVDARLRFGSALNGHLAVRLEPVYECPAPDTLAMHLTAQPTRF